MPLRCLFLVQGLDAPATRYRVLQFLEFLPAGGIEPEVRVWPRSVFAWHRTVREARRNATHVLFLQKKRPNKLARYFLRSAGLRWIYDVDDAVMFASSRHASPESPTRWKRFERVARRATGVIAGNAYLRTLVEPLNPRVWVVPTAMDLRKYFIRPSAGSESHRPVTLGWIGGAKSLVFLEGLVPVIAGLARTRPGLRLKIVCNRFLEVPGVAVEKKNWAEAEEARDVASFDVGLAPLPDDPWSRGKCATKLLQCMAAGVPTVASAVGAHTEILTSGVNGFLARTPEEWSRHLEALLDSAALRARVGLAGRRRVEEAYSVQSQAPRFIEILRTVAGG